MNNALILCDGVKGDDPGAVRLNLIGQDTNLKATIQNLSHQLFKNLDDYLVDFIRIAVFLYGADGAVSRGRLLDVYAQKWVRNFSFVIPVKDPDFWNQSKILDSLTACLYFLTGDQYSFEFVNGISFPGQHIFNFGEQALPCKSIPDSVLAISGGLDSLAAAIQSAKEDYLHPILVSHWSNSKIKNRQTKVIEGLREKIPEWEFPWIGMWTHAQGISPIERTQRCRSFLYLSLATVCAKQLGINKIKICDNGVTSINLPHTDATRGTFLTRHAHPKFLYLYEQLANNIGSVPVIIENNLWNYTKAEVINIIAENNCAELIQETCSCSRTFTLTNMQQHCGTCSQCVDRRFATEIAGVSDYDMKERYVKDIFSEPLEEGEARTNAENYVRFVYNVKGLSDNSFIEKFPEIFDCIAHLPGEQAEAYLLRVYQLHLRHAKNVWDLVENKCKENVRTRMEGNLSDHSLIGMVFSNEIHSNIRERYVRMLENIFSEGIPPAFKHNPAVNEIQVQDIGHACLISAKERLDRESPMIPFAGIVTTKPDFSKNDGRHILFVEFKYSKDRTRLNHINTEITSRILIYKTQGAFVLFIIYDPNRTIINDGEYKNTIEEHEGVWIKIVR